MYVLFLKKVEDRVCKFMFRMEKIDYIQFEIIFLIFYFVKQYIYFGKYKLNNLKDILFFFIYKMFSLLFLFVSIFEKVFFG